MSDAYEYDIFNIYETARDPLKTIYLNPHRDEVCWYWFCNDVSFFYEHNV